MHTMQVLRDSRDNGIDRAKQSQDKTWRRNKKSLSNLGEAKEIVQSNLTGVIMTNKTKVVNSKMFFVRG